MVLAWARPSVLALPLGPGLALLSLCTAQAPEARAGATSVVTAASHWLPGP